MIYTLLGVIGGMALNCRLNLVWLWPPWRFCFQMPWIYFEESAIICIGRVKDSFSRPSGDKVMEKRVSIVLARVAICTLAASTTSKAQNFIVDPSFTLGITAPNPNPTGVPGWSEFGGAAIVTAGSVGVTPPAVEYPLPRVCGRP